MSDPIYQIKWPGPLGDGSQFTDDEMREMEAMHHALEEAKRTGVLQRVEPAHIITIRGVSVGNWRITLSVEDWADLTGLPSVHDVKFGKYMLVPVDAALEVDDE